MSAAKPEILLLPGMEGTGLLYHRQLERLKPYFRSEVMPYDVDGPQTFAQFVAQARTLLREIPGAESPAPAAPAYLCGFSMGGCTAIELTLQCPGQIHALFLINPATAVSRTPFLPRLAARILPHIPPALLSLGSDLSIPANAVTRNFEAEDLALMQEVSRSVPRQLMAARLQSIAGFDASAERLAQLRLPVLILAGARDHVLPSVKEAHRLAAALPDAQVCILPDSGHECLQERGLNLGTIFRDFLEERGLHSFSAA